MSFQPLTLTPDFAVAGQITKEDVQQIAAQGFRTIINNRPGEGRPPSPSTASSRRRRAGSA